MRVAGWTERHAKRVLQRPTVYGCAIVELTLHATVCKWLWFQLLMPQWSGREQERRAFIDCVTNCRYSGEMNICPEATTRAGSTDLVVERPADGSMLWQLVWCGKEGCSNRTISRHGDNYYVSEARARQSRRISNRMIDRHSAHAVRGPML